MVVSVCPVRWILRERPSAYCSVPTADNGTAVPSAARTYHQHLSVSAISSLRLRITSSNDTNWRLLISHCPHLTDVDVDARPGNAWSLDLYFSILDALSDCSSSLTRVRLSLYMPHNNDLLLALAACPALEKLMLSLHTDGDDDESALPVAAFPCPSFTALRELACLSTTPSPVQAILASGFPGGLGRRPMSRIETTLPIRTLEELATLLDAVHDYCDHRALETFYLHMLTHGAPVVLSRTALAPLAAFRSLVEITLAGIQTLALDDGDWEEVAGWWPRLAVFEINPYAKSRCPLSTLASFARHCPRLTSLQLPIDARVVRRIEEDDGVEEDGIGHYVDSPEMRLEPDLSIDVGDAPIVDSSGISEYLIAVFPNIVAVHFGVRDLDEEGFRIPLAQQDYTREQWQEVSRAVWVYDNDRRRARDYYRQAGE